MKNLNGSCPDPLDLEVFYLTRDLKRELAKDPDHHLHTCRECQRALNELDSIYTSILKELSAPVSGRELDIANKHGHQKLIKGLYLCTPLPLVNSPECLAFQIKRFNTSQKEPLRFRESDNITAPANTLLLRTMYNAEEKALFFYFKSVHPYNYASWTITITGCDQKTLLRPDGSAKIAYKNIETIENSLILLEKKAQSVTVKPVIQKFQECLA